ncbi:hypothetical protein TYRP_011112 [Tyrophagus putrescentiae]|nr:hypothetical protein TYRP_011112 [Tyrophagus putrescentiae]
MTEEEEDENEVALWGEELRLLPPPPLGLVMLTMATDMAVREAKSSAQAYRPSMARIQRMAMMEAMSLEL